LFNARKEVLEEARSWRNERGEEITATLVLTGQPSIKYDKDGKGTLDVRYGDAIKYKEFLFPQPIKEISVREEVMKNFNFAYPDEKLKRLPLPVFFHTSILQDEDGKQPEVVHSFGLAYMYKIPFTHSVKDAIRRYQEGSGAGPDLAECIFGHVEKDKALRGRVTFGHAFAVNVRPNVGDIKNEVLNSPKATYYPTYIRQDIKPNGKVKDDKYKTLFDKDAVPAGWKRYPVHSGTVETNPGPKDNNGNYNEKIQTRFQPLAAGTQFTCTVFYHNLNKIELGALLSALTFHNSQGCFHTLGMAKPLGYGKCTITVSGIDDTLKQKCLCKYEEYMKNKLGIDWLNSDQLRDLFAMSRNQENKGRSELKYMDDVKDFAKVKNQKLALDCYTNLEGIAAITINTACEAKLSEKPVAAEMAPNPKTEFERRKQQLIKDLQEKRSTLEAKEQQEREAEALRKLVVEQERLQQEKEAEVKRKQQTDAAAELAAGINLNGVTERKTIDGLLRTTKRWVETLNGSIETSEIDRIKSRFSQLYSQLRAKDRQTWLQHLKNDLPKLEPFLSKPQIQELEEHVNSLHNGKSC
jgi:hypothetical protein